MKTSTETTIYNGFIAINKKTKSRFYAAIPATKIVTPIGYGQQTTYKSSTTQQAIDYVLSNDFLNREDSCYWKEAIEKWGKDNFYFTFHPEDIYESEEDFFERYANPIIFRMYQYTDVKCYNEDFTDFDEYVDWDKIKEEGKEYTKRVREELESNKHHKLGRTSDVISIKDLRTGEILSFDSKGKLTEYLKCGSATLSRFLKGNTKLNKLYEIL